MIIYKGYEDNTGRLLTLTEYNRLAQRASRKRMSTEQYIESLGFTKVWGRGRANWKSDLLSMVTARN